MGSDYLTLPFDDLLKPVDNHLIVHNELMTSLILGNRISIHSSEKGIPDLDFIKIAIIGIPEERNSGHPRELRTSKQRGVFACLEVE